MLSLLALSLVAATNGDTILTADPGACSLHYRVVHKLHEVEAVSRSVEAKALVSADGTVRVMVRAPVASFRSGDGNRDEHMLEAVEASRFPYATVKATGRVQLPAVLPAKIETVMDAVVDFHGVQAIEKVPVAIALAQDGTARVTGTFNLSLDRYHVDRPSLLFVKIDDACSITIDLTLRRGGP